MKITVGRLKTIIQEELDGFKKLEEMCPPGGPEEIEALGPAVHVASAEQTELILDELKEILEEWEEAEYESDEERWQTYAEDIQGLVDNYEEDEEYESDEGEGEDLEEMIRQEVFNFLEESE